MMKNKIKILFVYSKNGKKIAPFILEQALAIKQLGVSVDYFGIEGKGIMGYLNNLSRLKKTLYKENVDLIHAHYGFSGLLSNLQRKIPVITTYHGTDVNIMAYKLFSYFSMLLSQKNIFVSKQLLARSMITQNSNIVGCGVDFDVFFPIDTYKARKELRLEKNKKYILFSSNFNNTIKNYPLAKNAIDLVNDNDIELLELKNYTRKEVNLLLNAVNLALMTSFSEGSPQFIKEAMACNCTIVSTNVGNLEELKGSEPSIFLTNQTPEDIASKIKMALLCSKNDQLRNRIINLELENSVVAKKILSIYKGVII